MPWRCWCASVHGAAATMTIANAVRGWFGRVRWQSGPNATAVVLQRSLTRAARGRRSETESRRGPSSRSPRYADTCSGMPEARRGGAKEALRPFMIAVRLDGRAKMFAFPTKRARSKVLREVRKMGLDLRDD